MDSLKEEFEFLEQRRTAKGQKVWPAGAAAHFNSRGDVTLADKMADRFCAEITAELGNDFMKQFVPTAIKEGWVRDFPNVASWVREWERGQRHLQDITKGKEWKRNLQDGDFDTDLFHLQDPEVIFQTMSARLGGYFQKSGVATRLNQIASEAEFWFRRYWPQLKELPPRQGEVEWDPKPEPDPPKPVEVTPAQGFDPRFQSSGFDPRGGNRAG